MSKKILITISDEQSEATGPLVEATGEKSLSDLVRRLLKEEASRVGTIWPDNMLTPEQTIQKAYQARWPKSETSA